MVQWEQAFDVLGVAKTTASTSTTSTTTALNTMPQALRKLSAQAEDLGAANLGDLEGFAKDMSEDVSKLRQVSEVAVIMRVLHPFLYLNYHV